MSEHRLFRFPRPAWLNSANTRSFGVYLAGALFAIAVFLQLDASIYSASPLNGSHFHVTITDWVPAIFSLLGLLIINSIDKSRLTSDTFSPGSSFGGADGQAWTARVVLFMGFAAMAGGLAGGVTVCVLKYVVPGAKGKALWFGVADVCANAGVMASTVVLWISQNMEDDYTYNLAL